MQVSRRGFMRFAGAAAAFTAQSNYSFAIKDMTSSLIEEANRIRQFGKRLIELDAGDFLISPQTSRPVALDLPYGVEIRGAGRSRTRILMAPNASGHVINATEGGLRLFDLTIDGQASQRFGQRGHNVRFEGEGNVIERVDIINSCSYGIGAGQRRYARARLKDVFIGNSGADGVDCKNAIGKTEVAFENILVDRIGSLPIQSSSAGIDIRGKCALENIRIRNVGDRHALRFRHGESGEKNGPGGHGSIARNITIEDAGLAFAITARDVRIESFKVNRALFAFAVGAANLSVSDGETDHCIGVTQFSSRKGSATFERVRFVRSSWRKEFDGGSEFKFMDCVFEECPPPKNVLIVGGKLPGSC
jgi:hypothetical protein